MPYLGLVSEQLVHEGHVHVASPFTVELDGPCARVEAMRHIAEGRRGGVTLLLRKLPSVRGCLGFSGSCKTKPDLCNLSRVQTTT